MEGTRFDRLAQALAAGVSRRRVLGGLLGGAAGLGGVAAAGAGSQCRPAGTKCSKDGQCCAGPCLNRICGATCPNGCSGNGTCDPTTGTCACYPGSRGLDCSAPCFVANPCALADCPLVCCSGNYGGCGAVFSYPSDPNFCYCLG